MKHPILETLFFLKIARESVCDSIKTSDISGKNDLINYVQNEASDYEIMHLITVGEMPTEKFNPVAEQQIWNIFKESVIMNASSLRKNMLKEDIMNIVYEMAPVSQLGYSSASPILEFDRANGRLDIGYLNERIDPTGETKKDKVRNALYDTKEVTRQAANKGFEAAKKRWTTTVNNDDSDPNPASKANYGQIGKDAGGVALGAAGLYGLYKLYKAYKAKKAAAKTPEQKAAADKGMASTKAKIAAKKGKKK